MKLWQKGEDINSQFERFSIGQDAKLDLDLAYYDVLGTMAHVEMLGKISILQHEEVQMLLKQLEILKLEAQNGTFKIEEGVEDCHSQIELQLTRALGDVGKKVHTGRSRNDQVLTALKLFSKAELAVIAKELSILFDVLIAKSEQYKDSLMPGYTHMQVAMPSSFGLWFGAYAESLTDDLIVLKAAHKVADKNPLGSGAGYGSSFPLDREATTESMGFSGLNVNVVYAQMTRGKMEKIVASALGGISATLSKLASDVCLYAGQNFNFFKVGLTYTTGSSIMPHKHNPDGFELVRAKCNQLQALPFELSMITANLPSGYHRDLQVLKENYLPAFGTLKDCLQITIAMIKSLEINTNLVSEKKYEMLFTVEDVNQLVLEGVPFREAYQQVAEQIKSGKYVAKKEVNHTHVGSVGNLSNSMIKEIFKTEWAYFA